MMSQAPCGLFSEGYHFLSVEGLYPTPHIHEQMTAYIMATLTTTLSTTR